MSSNKIVLKSSDEECFEIDEVIGHELGIISHLIEDGCVGKDPIPIQNVTGNILAKIIEYCKKHVEAGSVEEDVEEEKKKKLDDWDKEFMKQDLEAIFQITLAANYLNIKGLLDLTCQTIADSIKDKTVDEVREIFHIENDFTPEEEAEVRKENEWAFE